MAVHAVEVALAEDHPFGDSRYIGRRVVAHYRRRLEMISSEVEWARAFLALCGNLPEHQALGVLGDPVVRALIDAWTAHTALGTPLPDHVNPEADVRAAITAGVDMGVPPLAAAAYRRVRLASEPWPWMWTTDRSDPDPLGDILTGFLHDHHPGLNLRTPGSDLEQSLIGGSALLRSVCPEIATSAFAHVQLVCLAEADAQANFTSLTDPQLPGVVLLSPRLLQGQVLVAECLLHEALHLKFIDLEHTHSMLVPYADVPDWPMVSPPWHQDKDRPVEWPVNRALTVLHVYTGLAMLYAALSQKGVDVEAEGDGHLLGGSASARSQQARERASLLSTELQAPRCQAALGFAGRLFVAWLASMLVSLQRSDC